MKGLRLNPVAGRLIGWALGYAERGWEVFPVRPRGKRPMVEHGVLVASTDVHQITDWWTRWPNANIGVRTGIAFDVLDIDGDIGWASLREKVGPEPEHSGPISLTSHGEHWLFQPDGTSNRGNLLPKLDWRGTNGYIIAPPSVHAEGHVYAWAPNHGQDVAIPPRPAWLDEYMVPWEAPPDERPVKVMVVNKFQSKHPVKAKVYGADRIPGSLTDIVALAEEMGLNPRKDGRLYAISCVFHEGDREPSMKLYPADNSFYCFGCGAWGDSENLREGRRGGTRAQG